MSGGKKSRRTMLMAALTAGALALGYLAPAAFAEGGGGGSGGQVPSQTADAHWIYKDSWPATLEGMKQAIRDSGTTLSSDLEDGSNQFVDMNAILADAISECKASYTGEGDAECRMVAVGYARLGNGVFSGSYVSSNARQRWESQWAAEGRGTYQYQGQSYTTGTTWTDRLGVRSVDSLVQDSINANPDASFRVVVLAKNQPPVDYPLTVTTSHRQQTDMQVGSTTPVGDTIHANNGGSSIKETLHGTAIVHYDGGPYTPTGSVSKPISFANSGDTVIDNLASPGDFGMDSWAEGTYWIDVQVPKQGSMQAAVDTTDRDPAETWKVSAVPPADPVKSIEEGVSADRMTNRTTITYGTGRGGYEMSFRDVIEPNGVDYTVDGFTLVDATDNDRDVSDEFEIGWDRASNTVSAVRSADKGMMPFDHEYVFGFDVTVSLPSDYQNISDHAWGKWNQLPEADAGEREFDTWRPNPDKSWIMLDADGKWQAVIDPDRTNQTGGDGKVFLDGDRVASVVTATTKSSYLTGLKDLEKARQITMLVPGRANYANGAGAGQVRDDFGIEADDEITFCTAGKNGAELTNAGSQTINTHTVETNEPKVCGYVPSVAKDVVGESSQGGAQDSVDGKIVFPGQRLEYRLETQPHLPDSLTYTIVEVAVTDTYDEHFQPDKQTLEVTDLTTGKFIPKSQYRSEWNDANHAVRLVFADDYVRANWLAGANPRIIIRFEGVVAEDAPADTVVDNRWALTLNNSVTPSNKVWNDPPDFQPGKEDTQADPSISIDGKTALLGDRIYYRINLDAKQTNHAYKVWRLGMVDDWDDEYLELDENHITVTDKANGRDVTDRFNIQAIDGVAYVFAKTVDTEVPATGETIKGDPQPADLKIYAALGDKDHDPLKDPAIDQSLLGTSYEVTLPMTVIKVTDDYVVTNTATQLVNDVRKDTNQVSNPLKPINPAKDVVVKVDGQSVDGKSIYLNSLFLYRLDSSTLPPDRAYPQVSDWSISDPLDTRYDKFTGQWAVYAARDLIKDGETLAERGERIAGSDFDASRFGGELFELAADERGVVTVRATELMLGLVSADTEHEQAWTAFIQCQRIAVGGPVSNQFTETINGVERPSNTVTTHTPDMTPWLTIEKWDEQSGWPDGDRDTVDEALNMNGRDTRIVFTITNASPTDPDTGDAPWFKASELSLTDQLVAGDGQIGEFEYPDDWQTLILKPGDSVEVKATLSGVSEHHTDRAIVTGVPLVQCIVSDPDPFDGKDEEKLPEDAVEIDGRTLCADTTVTSNTDDWNGYQPKDNLATTGTNIAGLIAVILVLALLGTGATAAIRLTRANGRHTGHENDANDDGAGRDGSPNGDGPEPDFAQLVTTINPKEPPMN
ncbi:LPXTG cell wall anchor domain-containing protein [Bifidobacterium catenulatum]|uniref:LPXTG cell wall anchor domain-containing protein n=1 Tax=Bifidobacterium catenulatum subsp. kashiwanohense TaxID=630129 RepID=A0AA43P6Z9_9BIFI|nr:LPXTG cell wall anchor domain-containing protein [Bifidobacterium catenulatum]MDH7890213.1 LPXTG cell wall anchor domain-containing protein [Bifidobacterium catenulatum subsp. kashiwanohense]